MKNYLPIILVIFLFTACNSKKQVDLILKNAKIYTVDSNFTIAQAFAVTDGKIVEVGTTESILAAYDAKEIIDAENNPKLPLAEKYISKIQKDKYKTKIAEFEYNIKTYKNSVNQNKP